MPRCFYAGAATGGRGVFKRGVGTNLALRTIFATGIATQNRHLVPSSTFFVLCHSEFAELNKMSLLVSNRGQRGSASLSPTVKHHKNMNDTKKTNTQTKLAYTRDEAAAQLGVHPITIDRLAERGLLRPSRATRRPLYSHDELQRFLRDTASKSLN